MAATFAAGRCLSGAEVKSSDVLKVAEAFEQWVLKGGSSAPVQDASGGQDACQHPGRPFAPPTCEGKRCTQKIHATLPPTWRRTS
jgi:hypothetical protein